MALKQKQPSKVIGFAGLSGAGKNSWAGYLQFYKAIKCLALGWGLQFLPAKTPALLLDAKHFLPTQNFVLLRRFRTFTPARETAFCRSTS